MLVENAEQQQEAMAAGADSAPLKGHRAEQLSASVEGLLEGECDPVKKFKMEVMSL